MKKKYWLYLDKVFTHNSLTMTSDTGTSVMSIIAIVDDGSELEIINSPIEVSGDTSVSYEPITSNRLRVTISHPLANVLTLDELISINVSLQDYTHTGSFISEVQEIAFGEQLSVVHDIDNVLDVLFRCNLSIKTLDNYGNIIYAEEIPISINDDGYMVEYTDDDTLQFIELEYDPDLNSMYALIGHSKTREFKVVGRQVYISKPKGHRVFIVYKPKFLVTGSKHKISEDIEITPSHDLILRDSYCSKIKFTIKLEMINPDVTKITHTPVIKSLGLMVSSNL